MEQFDVPSKTGYGAAEIQKYHRRYTAIALTSALVLHFSGVSLFREEAVITGEGTGAVLERPIHFAQIPPIWRSPGVMPHVAGGMKPKVGMPIPVSGPIADTAAWVPPGEGNDSGVQTNEPGPPGPGEAGSVGGDDLDNVPPEPFVPFEHAPEAVKHVQPKYPDLATRAGIEGTVWVKIWIDKAGKPRKAIVTKSEAEIFNQPAIEAAMQWIFTPAMMKNGPVSVWVSVPFRFKLQGK